MGKWMGATMALPGWALSNLVGFVSWEGGRKCSKVSILSTWKWSAKLVGGLHSGILSREPDLSPYHITFDFIELIICDIFCYCKLSLLFTEWILSEQLSQNVLNKWKQWWIWNTKIPLHFLPLSNCFYSIPTIIWIFISDYALIG